MASIFRTRVGASLALAVLAVLAIGRAATSSRRLPRVSEQGASAGSPAELEGSNDAPTLAPQPDPALSINDADEPSLSPPSTVIIAPRVSTTTAHALAAVIRVDNQSEALSRADLAMLRYIDRAGDADPAFDPARGPCMIDPDEDPTVLNSSIARFVAAFAQEDDDADINLDGQIDPDDLMTFVSMLAEGC